MELILNNPYRVVGLLVGATAKEQDRQIKRLKQFIEAEQALEDYFSFPNLGHLNRSIENVNNAASKLNLDKDKIAASLFWFFKGYEIIDEPAFDALKEGDLNQAIDIWKRLASSGEVSKRNSSSFSNLSSLLLFTSTSGLNIDYKQFEFGIELKIKFLESDFSQDLKELATDKTYNISKKELQLLFLRQLLSGIEKNKTISFNKFLEIISKLSFSAKEEILKELTNKPIELIEKIIEDNKKKRKANAIDSIKIGNSIYNGVYADLNLLRSILGNSSIKYAAISDKVSDEILQCGIDYFKYFKDTSTDPSGVVMELFQKALSLGVGNITKQRGQENLDSLKEWIKDKPEREKHEKVIQYLELLKSLIDEFEKKSETVANAKQLLLKSWPHLSSVKSILGGTDTFYVGISSRIAGDAQGMCVSEINKLQDTFAVAYDNVTKRSTLFLLAQKVNEALEVFSAIGGMELQPNLRTQFIQNKTSLTNLKSQLAAAMPSSSIPTSRGNSSGGSKGACYIATMTYGDYDHPQVMVLRKFRDEVLDKSTLGKWFIKTYYRYSPKLVEKLKNKRGINTLIRKTLNLFIKLIK